MEIITVDTVMADWFWTLLLVMGIIAAVVLIGSIIMAVVADMDWLGFGMLGLLVVGFIVLMGYVEGSGTVEPEEKVRVQQEVERISGEEITLEEVDSMLDGDPVRDVYYIKDGFDLIVEKDQT